MEVSFELLYLRLINFGLSASADCASFRNDLFHWASLERHLRSRGITFRSVLDEVRRDDARQLLRDTGLPISRIAAAAGFAEPASFANAFRRWTALTPLQWRKAQITALERRK